MPWIKNWRKLNKFELWPNTFRRKERWVLPIICHMVSWLRRASKKVRAEKEKEKEKVKPDDLFFQKKNYRLK